MAKRGPENYAKVKAWRKLNREKVNAQAARRRARHPEKHRAIALSYRHRNLEKVRAEQAERARMKRRNDPEGQRRRMAAYKARVEAKLVAIAGRPRAERCEICYIPAKTVFDHCHSGGGFRGWLCDRCNRTLGQVKDNPTLLMAMADYLLRHAHGKAHDGSKEGAPDDIVRDTWAQGVSN